MGTTLTRIRFTPMRDLIRGRVTGRLNWRLVIASAALPAEVRSLITDVVRRSRLRRMERADVAQEMVSHFVEAIAADTLPAEAIQHFGDIRTAAKLIRRAKIRNRSWLWHFFRWMRYGAGVVVVCYGSLAILYFTGHPSPTRDYVAEMNLVIERTPPSDRAWPVYRDALLTLHDPDSPDRPWPKVTGYEIDGKHWPELAAWLKNHSDALEQFRLASKKPAMGFILGPGGSAYDPKLSPGFLYNMSKIPAGIDSSLIDTRLPYLNETRYITNLLAADSKLAAEHGDAARSAEDLKSIVRIAEQVHGQDDFLVTGLVEIGIESYALDRLDWLLQMHPVLLSDQQLQTLAHLISGPSVAADLISLKTERNLFEDLVQRMYTDDGRGSGRMTPDGAKIFEFSRHLSDRQLMSADGAMTTMLGPASLLALAPRRDLLSQYNRVMDSAAAALHEPIRDVDPSRIDREIASLSRSTADTIRYSVILALLPTLNRPQVTAERMLGQRDGVEVALALEIFRRHRGGYPQTLAEMTPDLLPTVPLDRITGEPLKYRIVDGKPVVYSVGVDRKDDGGRVPVIHGKIDGFAAAEWRTSIKPVDGDWVLYPEPRAPADDDDE